MNNRPMQMVNKNYQNFLEDLPGELGGGDLVDEEPSGEEQADAQQDQGQVRVDLRVHWAGIPAHRFEVQLKGNQIVFLKCSSCL